MNEKKNNAGSWNDDNRISTIKKRLFSTIIGGIIGDALGVPAEFKARNLNITGMTGYGTYNQPPGTWSDDTSLTLCLMENLIEENDETELMKKFAAYREGYWTPYGRMFDIGRATDEAIERFRRGAPIEKCGGASEFDNGNGALMRISPLAFTLWNEPDFLKRKTEIERWAFLTHRHPRSTLGCIIYIECLIELFHQHPPKEAYQKAVHLCLKNLAGTEYENEFAAYQRILNEEVDFLKREEIMSDGYVVHSLEAALWCFLNHDRYSDAVLEAVNLGEDTDTIAFITGTLAGMHHKLEGIPEEWINALARKGDIMELCERFFQLCVKKAEQ
ncbi:ADP-ribosylglycohydrolase family protein [Bacillus swezeyi]|uniref:ADP-ribosylglycohydrolase family protein n=1 Tax=Bacillus swezeyi TaxID=1925020 RepID=UPI002E1B0204|nr:ADP-ribosylglycohydrolase family protein [Bacillus swezeyi]MED2941407.1 ADP-ribosylglycohydrolase family protein [Bacillus swezeyi]MED2976976.1 ADP-ribosylglycohydrolase family protein [Bacillus swezeyi]